MEPGKEWKVDVKPHGLLVQGTNAVTLEVSVLPPLNLEKRLQFLIQYPHGCVEQTTSSVFPQLYFARIGPVERDPEKRSGNQCEIGH